MPEFTALENVMMPGLIHLSHRSKGVSYADVQKKAEDILGQMGLKTE